MNHSKLWLHGMVINLRDLIKSCSFLVKKYRYFFIGLLVFFWFFFFWVIGYLAFMLKSKYSLNLSWDSLGCLIKWPNTLLIECLRESLYSAYIICENDTFVSRSYKCFCEITSFFMGLHSLFLWQATKTGFNILF